jgi:hypothetical protein
MAVILPSVWQIKSVSVIYGHFVYFDIWLLKANLDSPFTLTIWYMFCCNWFYSLAFTNNSRFMKYMLIYV